MLPVLPVRLNVVLFVLAHTDAAPLAVPATEAGFTVIIPAALNAVPQEPLINTALYCLVAVITE
jgi:hypothetical protein